MSATQDEILRQPARDGPLTRGLSDGEWPHPHCRPDLLANFGITPSPSF
jgi:hypothetical protein